MAVSSDLIGCKSSATKAELLLFFVFRDHILPPYSFPVISLVIGLNKTATYNPIPVTPKENLTSFYR